MERRKTSLGVIETTTQRADLIFYPSRNVSSILLVNGLSDELAAKSVSGWFLCLH